MVGVEDRRKKADGLAHRLDSAVGITLGDIALHQTGMNTRSLRIEANRVPRGGDGPVEIFASAKGARQFVKHPEIPRWQAGAFSVRGDGAVPIAPAGQDVP